MAMHSTKLLKTAVVCRCHVSMAGGIEKAVVNAAAVGKLVVVL